MSESMREKQQTESESVRNKTKRKKRQQQVGVEAGAPGSPDPPQPDRTGTEPLLRGIFRIGKRSQDVVLSSSRLTWTPIQPDHPTGQSSEKKPQENCVELKDVFAVKVKRRRSVGQTTGGTLLGITLFTCRQKGAKLKEHAIHLNNLSADHCEIWFKQLKEIISGFQDRPRSLKVFINPCSHKKEACLIYEDQVAPLFKLADIKTDVTITERKGHALSLLKDCSLEEYDGVVCVGGDGSVAEVAHGLLLRAQMDAGRDTDSIFMPVQAALPLGVIPAGSTDAVACSVHGIRHPVTAALHIIMGHRQVVDVSSVSSMGRLLRFCFSVMFGFGGRTLASAEKLTWIPNTQRREVAFITTLTNLKPEECELSFIPSSGGMGDQSDSELENELNDVGEGGPWQTRRSLFLNISIMSIPCLCSIAPRGLAPFTRLSNNSMALVAVGNTSRSEFIKHLKRYSGTNNQFSFSFVETQCVYAVRLKPRSHSGWTDETSEENEECDSKNTPIISSEGTYPWNIDGELLEVPGELLIRVHPRILTLFGGDVEEAEERAIKCSCI